MDPVSGGLLLALAGGAGGEVGRQVWAGLSALVRHPFRRGQDTMDLPAVSTGEAELAELQRTPADLDRAQALSTALAVRAAVDADFRASLERWHDQAKLVRTGDGETHNTISGGTFHGLSVQGRDFSGTSFTTTPPPSAASGTDTPPSQD